MSPAVIRAKLRRFGTLTRPPMMHFSQLTVMHAFIYRNSRDRLVRQARQAKIPPKVIAAALGVHPSAVYRIKP